MAYVSPSVQRFDKESFLLTSYDDLFERFFDSDSYGLSDNTTDRSISDEWDKFFDLPESLSGSEAIALSPQLPSCASPRLDLVRTSWAGANSSDYYHDPLDGFLEYPDIDHHLSSPGSSPAFNAKPTAPEHRKSSSLDLSRPRSAGIRKPNQRKSASPRMAQPYVFRRRNQDTWAQRMKANADNFDFSNHTYLSMSPPPSAPLTQMSWNDPIAQTSTSSRAASCHPSTSSVLETLSVPAHAHFSPLSSPLLDAQVGLGASYVQSPPTAYLNEIFAEQSLDWDYAASGLGLAYAEVADYSGARDMTQGGFDTMVYPAQGLSSPDAARPGRPAALSPSSTNEGLLIECAAGTNQAIELPSHTTSSLSDPRRGCGMVNNQSYSLPYRQAQPQPQNLTKRLSQPPTPRQTLRSELQPPTPPATPRSRKGSRGPYSHHRRSKTTTGVTDRRSHHSSSSAGFVNYTPDDSRKLLTGVAPSGSSKTKARREKEAADKRRNLSLAAAKAVLEAGGDVEELRRCGLFA